MTTGISDGLAKPQGSLLSRVILGVSCVVNVALLLGLLGRLSHTPILPGQMRRSLPEKFRTWPTWRAGETRSPSVDARVANQFPRFRGRISHVILVLRESGKELEQFQTTLESWEHFPPCLIDSYPTSVGQSSISLVIYLISAPRSRTLRKIRQIFDGLPSEVRHCFSQVQIVNGGLPRLDRNATAGEEREIWRQTFEDLVTNAARLKELNHVLLLSSNTYPVQPNWLNQADYQCRPPNDLVWHRGSIYRGPISRPPLELGALIRLSPAGLYFFADQAFADFYLERVRPWARQLNETEGHRLLQTGRPVDADRWAVDFAQYLAVDMENKSWLATTHQFRHADFILDYYGRTVSLAQMHRDNPDTVLVTADAIVP